MTIAVGASAYGQAFDGTVHVIACGGENTLSGGGYTATATVGQAVVTSTSVTNVQHTLSAGYWITVPPPPACCVGDVDADGIINGRDIQLFVQALLNPPAPGTPEFCLADVNQDAAITFNDVAPFVQLLIQGMGCP